MTPQARTDSAGAQSAALEQQGSPEKADLVVGLAPPSPDPHSIETGIARLIPANLPMRAVLVHPPYPTVTAQPSFREAHWKFISEPRLAQDRSELARSFGQGFRAVFEIAVRMDARACVIITSDLSSVTPEWIEMLVSPILNEAFDLITPCYATNPFDGLINRAIVYPMVRALYGKRVRNPMGPDFGLSKQLVARMGAGGRARLHPLVSLVAEAIAMGMKVGQVHLGPHKYATLDWSNLSPFVSQVLSALFMDVERFAPWWQRARGSHPIAEFGNSTPPNPSPPPVQPALMIAGFQAGARTLMDIWATALPPSTLVELQKLAREVPEGFRLSDEIWAQIVYGFAIAHRRGTSGRQQLLSSFTPLYMGWVASYALETASASPDAVEQRIEELCAAFESHKTYFVSRWRWPDRFNP